MLAPQILEKADFTIVGVEAAFISVLSPDATNAKVIGPLWDKLMHRVGQVQNRIGKDMFGVMYARPEAERNHPHEMQYLAGVPVTSAAKLPDGMTARTVGASAFAVFTHRGPIQTIGDTVQHIYRDWLPQSAYRHAGIADVELYDRRFSGGEDSEMEYWISVQQKPSSH